MRYRAPPATALATVRLDEFTAVYHRPSGATHLLVEPAPEILAALVEPLTLDAAGTYADGSARIERGRVTVGAGSLDISGTAGRQLDLRVAIDRLPLALANAARADLDARGTLSGTATATGSLADPAATFDLSAADVVQLVRNGFEASWASPEQVAAHLAEVGAVAAAHGVTDRA